MAEYVDTNHCQRCGHALEQRDFEGKPRPTCPSCGFIVFLDPKVAVVVLVTGSDKLLFVQRGAEPQIGKWCFPGGYVDRGEEVRGSCAARGPRGNRAGGGDYRPDRSLFAAVEPGHRHSVFRQGSGRTTGRGYGRRRCGWFEVGTLPELAFPHNVKIIEDWEAAQQAG